MKKHFLKQFPSPTLHPEFFINSAFLNPTDSGCKWWLDNQEGDKQRVLFLEKLIKEL